MGGRHNIRGVFVGLGQVALGSSGVPQFKLHHPSAGITKVCSIDDGLA